MIVITGRAGDDVVLHAGLDINGNLLPLPDDPGLLCYLEGAHIGIRLVDALEERSSVTVYYSDASSSAGNGLYTPPTSHLSFPAELLVKVDWSGVDTRRESKAGRDGKPNVQDAMTAWHTDPSTGSASAWVVNDDGSGEMADLIVIQLPLTWFDDDNSVIVPFAELPVDALRVTLCHCKWAGSDTPRRNLGDLDEVVGQAHRSVRWLANPRAFWKTLAERATGRAKIVAGDPIEVRSLLSFLATNTPQTEFRIQIAQPGLDVAQVAGWATGETLLSFLVDAAGTVGAEITVIGA